MLQLIDKLGLKRTLYATFTAALVLVIGLTAVVLNRVVQTELEDALRRRAESDARLVAAQVAAPLLAGKDDLVAAEIETVLREQRRVRALRAGARGRERRGPPRGRRRDGAARRLRPARPRHGPAQRPARAHPAGDPVPARLR